MKHQSSNTCGGFVPKKKSKMTNVTYKQLEMDSDSDDKFAVSSQVSLSLSENSGSTKRGQKQLIADFAGKMAYKAVMEELMSFYTGIMSDILALKKHQQRQLKAAITAFIVKLYEQPDLID